MFLLVLGVTHLRPEAVMGQVHWLDEMVEWTGGDDSGDAGVAKYIRW